MGSAGIFKKIPGEIRNLRFPTEVASGRLLDINNMDFVRYFASKRTLQEKYETLTRFDLSGPLG